MAGYREHPRTPIELEVFYRGINRFFADYTKNISKGGTFIRTFAPLKVGTPVQFQLKIPSLPEPLELVGEVVRIADRGDPGMGIRFVWGDPAQRAAFERMVEKIMSDALGQTAADEILRHSRE